MATAGDERESVARTGPSRGLLLPALVIVAVAHVPEVAVGQEPRGSDAVAVATQPLGMTSWRREPVTLATPNLGMTGWRHAPVTLATPNLGMTGWRHAPVTVTTPNLGMTGWRHEPITVATPKLGMTDWQRDPVVTETPKLGMTGWRREPVAAVPPARLKTPSREVAPPRAVDPPPKLTCMGGRVDRGRCACARGFKAVRAGAGAFRCVQAVTLPKLKFNLKPNFNSAAPSRRAIPRREPTRRPTRTR